MTVTCVFSGRTSKENENITDCQDYFQTKEEVGCFAIADGASQSFYPSIWAKLLVDEFCQNPGINWENWEEWLLPIQKKWFKTIQERVKRAKEENKPTWIEGQNGLASHRAATSTFIGMRVAENNVSLSIVGDSCLFWYSKEDNKPQSYLLKGSKDFDDRPKYFASYPKDNNFEPHFHDILLEHDENYFFLATDALSEYIFKCLEQKIPIFKKLLSISSQEEFKSFIASARKDNNIKMKNDDVTLMVLVTNHGRYQPHRKQTDEANIEAVPPTTEVKDTENTVVQRQNTENIDNDTQHIRKLTKENNSLKRQRAVLGLLLLFVIILFPVSAFDWNFSNETEEENTTRSVSNETPESDEIPQEFGIPQGTVIYGNQDLTQILVSSLSNSVDNISILEEGQKWIKFGIPLYAYESIVSSCPSCTENEIEINPDSNLRLRPSIESEKSIFGQLESKSKFEKLNENSPQDWYEFRFVGYIEK